MSDERMARPQSPLPNIFEAKKAQSEMMDPSTTRCEALVANLNERLSALTSCHERLKAFNDRMLGAEGEEAGNTSSPDLNKGALLDRLSDQVVSLDIIQNRISQELLRLERI